MIAAQREHCLLYFIAQRFGLAISCHSKPPMQLVLQAPFSRSQLDWRTAQFKMPEKIVALLPSTHVSHGNFGKTLCPEDPQTHGDLKHTLFQMVRQQEV